MKDYLVPLETPCVYYCPSLFLDEESKELYEELHKTTGWETSAKINRWVYLMEETPSDYKYRDAPSATPPSKDVNGQKQPQTAPSHNPFSDTVKSIKKRVEDWYNTNRNNQNDGATDDNAPPVEFNVCLLNYYEDGNQRIGWHSDREEIGRNTPIASVSFGATRDFQIRSKQNAGRDRSTLALESGSVVIMENQCQLDYLHSIPRQSAVTEGRINLTFRCKRADEANTAGEEEHERRDTWMERIAASRQQNGDGNEEEDFYLHDQGTSIAIDGVASSMNVDATTTQIFGNEMPTTFVKPEDPNVAYVVSCNIGTEHYAANEVLEIISTMASSSSWHAVTCPWGIAGYVAIEYTAEPSNGELENDSTFITAKTDLVRLLLELRSVVHVLEYHDHFDVQEAASDASVEISKISAEDLYKYYKQRLVDGMATIPTLKHTSIESEQVQPKIGFRVNCDRIGGPHAFRSAQVEFEVGGAMSEYYESTCVPRMKDYDVNVRVDIVSTKVIIGSQQNVDELSKRHFIRYRNGVSIKCNIAYVLLRLAGIGPSSRDKLLVDPFCGSATLLLEALEMTNKGVRCIGMDVSRKSVKGAKENAVAEGCLPDICELHCCDARGLRKHVPDNSTDAFVSNLPWGIMTGNKQGVSDLQQMYEIFLRSAWYCLKDGGRLVMLVLRGLQMTRIIRKLSGRYRLIAAQIVRTTNNLPCIIVVEKISQDTLHNSLKGQLLYMNQFVNVSKELYHAIHMETIDDDKAGPNR